MPRLSANLSFLFTEVPFLERFGAARRAGFDAVECLFPYDDSKEVIAELLTRHGLTMGLINAPCGDWDKGERGFGCRAGQEMRFRQSVLQSIETAIAFDCATIHVMSGLIDTNESLLAQQARLAENLAWACDQALRERITLTIEPINGRDIPGYFLTSIEQAGEMLSQVGRTNLKIQADLYHLQILQGDLSRRLSHFIDRIGHIQIASVPLRQEPDRGELSIHYLLEWIDTLGYQGLIGCEYRPAAGTETGLAWASRYLKRSSE
jgi:hydroxypyruvate isomerase